MGRTTDRAIGVSECERVWLFAKPHPPQASPNRTCLTGSEQRMLALGAVHYLAIAIVEPSAVVLEDRERFQEQGAVVELTIQAHC